MVNFFENLYDTMKIRHYIPGLAVVLVIAILSYYLSAINPSFDALVISIIIGMLAGNILGERNLFEKGSEGALKVFLPLGIALYGSQVVLHEMNPGLLFTIFLVSLGLFGLTLLIAGIFNLDRKTGVLLASGISICGASAIAVISPIIGAKREDTSISIISVMMLGLTGMIFYPILYDVLALSREEFNFLAGTTLPMLGQVKVAASNVCPECLSAAVKIKLIRISFLFFLITASVILSGKREKSIKVPWFVIAFIVLALGANFTNIFSPVVGHLGAVSSFCLSAALAAIGFSVDFSSIIEKGIAPLGVIFFSWGVVILLMYLVRNLF